MVLQENLPVEERDREEWAMGIAMVAAKRSRCPRASVGAVISRGGTIIAVSYNAAPSGTPHCEDTDCNLDAGHCIISTHAEINAIAGCAKLGVRTEGGTMTVTHSPCHACAKAILRAGIKRVVYEVEYDHVGIDMLKNAGCEVYQL